MTIKLLNETIEYTSDDTGKEKVIFIHGFGSNGAVINRLKKYNLNFDLVQIDLPGCGKSTMNKEICSLEYMYEIVVQFIKETKFNFKFAISHSMGSDIVLQLLKNKLVEKAILVSPLTYQLHHTKINIKNNILPTNSEQAKQSLLNLFAHHSEGFLSIVDRQAQTALNYANEHRSFFEAMVDNQILNSNYLNQKQFDIFQKYHKYISIIVGQNDLFTVCEALEKLAKEHDINFYTIPDCGHAIFVEKSETTANLINNIYNDI
ncbi:alpha/beta fold family hydrolase [Mycoplasmopsis californica]|uniref:Alpha/beta hydrolase n=1 Tax=Mycoplasmopsis equigenitalium TaxID=114883 RepID=A0ABY5J102_9BACT|nr:alpha/beta hydrolase [Mycoplasmopsis equigenitalium]UUD36942.1 alpha/beta hydrolase [Mycoplasmopsis equigenitalium]VEU69763.1 alpha/beta fold family hydrolase [Mycoplasmopsis californica]